MERTTPYQGEQHQGWICPDVLYDGPYNHVAFIYFVDSGIFLAGGNEAHLDIIKYNIAKVVPELVKLYKSPEYEPEDQSVDDIIRGVINKNWNYLWTANQDLIKYNKALFGRVGTCDLDYEKVDPDSRPTIVSFWNRHTEIYKHLQKCLNRLIDDEIISPDDKITISTPIKTWKTFADQEQSTVDWATDSTEPDTKRKQAPPRNQQHEWSKAMKDKGLLAPGAKWWAPHSEEIQRIADTIEEENEEGMGWINPDTLYGYCYDTSTTFIYLINANKLFSCKENTHFDILMNNRDEILQLVIREYKYNQEFRSGISGLGSIVANNSYGAIQDLRTIMTDYNIALFGRSAPLGDTIEPRLMALHNAGSRYIVSFWNRNPKSYERIRECIGSLKAENIIDPNFKITISTPLDTWSEQGKTRSTKTSTKKAANIQQHEWSKAMRDKNLLVPGGKWWAPQSEEIQRIADLID